MPLDYRIAKITSYILHPLLMPTYALLLMFNMNTNISYVPKTSQLAVLLVTFIATFVLPLLTALLLLINGHIESIQLRTREERRLPYMFGAVCFMLGFYLVNSLVPLPKPIQVALLGANLCLVLALIINQKWKISMHMIGIGGLMGMIIGLCFRFSTDLRLMIVFLCVCAGLTGFARLRLNAHKPKEVYFGFLLGFLCEYLMLMMF